MNEAPGIEPVRERILTAYIARLNEEGRPPATVFRFCRDLGITEGEFFAEFPSFEAVEDEWWRRLAARVIQAVEGGPEWAEFTARQRWLTFLFAWQDAALEHRSLLLLRCGGCVPRARTARMEAEVREFAGRVVAHGVAAGEIAPRGRLGGSYPSALWRHFRAVVEFSVRDRSDKFERTDAFIEKSAGLAFDLLRPQAIDSLADLLRFLAAGFRA